MHIEWALRQPSHRDGWPKTANGAAERLNERGIPSPMGGSWTGISVRNMARRLALTAPPTVRVSHQVLWTRARAILKEHPDFTIAQLRTAVRKDHPVGTSRATAAIRRFRRSMAGRNALQKRLRWPLDRRLAARIRISKIWKRYPDCTAKQMIKALGPVEFSVKEQWVQRVLNRCWLVSARHSRKQLHSGRRRYIPR
jgi:hypothetical protein